MASYKKASRTVAPFHSACCGRLMHYNYFFRMPDALITDNYKQVDTISKTRDIYLLPGNFCERLYFFLFQYSSLHLMHLECDSGANCFQFPCTCKKILFKYK